MTAPLSWMEDRAGDALLADLILGRRKVVAEDVGKLAGRLFSQMSEDGSPPALATRLAVALMFTGALTAPKDEAKARFPLQFAAEMWEELGNFPAAESYAVAIGDAVVALPFAAIRYAEACYGHLLDYGAVERCRSALAKAIETARGSGAQEVVEIWLRLNRPTG